MPVVGSNYGGALWLRRVANLVGIGPVQSPPIVWPTQQVADLSYRTSREDGPVAFVTANPGAVAGEHGYLTVLAPPRGMLILWQAHTDVLTDFGVGDVAHGIVAPTTIWADPTWNDANFVGGSLATPANTGTALPGAFAGNYYTSLASGAAMLLRPHAHIPPLVARNGEGITIRASSVATAIEIQAYFQAVVDP